MTTIGWLDLVSANGAVKGVEALMLADDPYPLHQRNQLWRNNGKGDYTDVSGRAGEVFTLSEVSRGVTGGDFDNDGDLDLLITNNSGPARLLINQQGQDNAWLGVTLLDRKGKAPFTGARASLSVGGRTLWRWARRDGSYASSRDPRLLFGLGDSAQPQFDVTVVWPGDEHEVFRGLARGR